MSNTLTKEQREEALAKVAEVLEEAMAEYEMLEKMDLELAEDPTRPMMAAKPEDEESEEEDQDDESESEDDDKDEDKKDESEEEEMSDEALKSEYAAVMAKMETRGLLKKEEPKTEDVKKTEEAAPAPAAKADDKSETLAKSVDERFESLTKTIEALTATVEKIAAAPAPRKGLSGVTPLRKSEEGESESLNKAEVVNKLLELKKSGKQVPTELFMRVETGRTTDADIKFIKGILG